ncbi:MAG: hypothetical protein HY652_07170 [Acidobacteria bacterium]|nr:hypothetical protein [Acidobacteriota bacterium]
MTAFQGLGVVLALLTATASASGPDFSFEARHDHFLGSCKGKLVFSAGGAQFEGPKHRLSWDYRNIQSLDILSDRQIEIISYESRSWQVGRDKRFRFDLPPESLTKDFFDLVRVRIGRPIRTRYLFPSTVYRAQLAVRHRHRLGGCQGSLKIAEDRIIFESEEALHSRIWFYRDIQTMALTDPFQFRLSTPLETHTFDLKEPLVESLYRFIWQKVYRPE